MKLGILFSGGKDSNYALFKANKSDEVTVLISLDSKNEESYMFHTPIEEVDKQAKRLGIPLIKIKTKGEKEKELEDLKKAIKEAKQIKWESGLDDALFRLSSIYNMTGDYSNALIYANKTFLIRKKLNDKRKMAAVFELFGKIYYNQGDYLKCLNYFFN